MGEFPYKANDGHLEISLPSDKANSWAALVDETIIRGEIQHASLWMHIGKISVSQTALFWKSARTMIAPFITSSAQRYTDHLATYARKEYANDGPTRLDH